MEAVIPKLDHVLLSKPQNQLRSPWPEILYVVVVLVPKLEAL
jgi:hypothetical protein